MTDNLEQRVVEIIAQFTETPPSSIHAGSTFDELGLTSLDAVTITYELEQELGIELTESDTYSINSVQDLIDGITQLTRAGTET
ncbi:MAG: acyl carrier protein [Gammaproteobacteria bacterium]|nr:acyl carrier protein [Gammaproteobacteria bacterium]MDH5654217.1 acyl carrier protein [Gammaproteobacteria bacterium]